MVFSMESQTSSFQILNSSANPNAIGCNTDTHIYHLSLGFALSIHNKQQGDGGTSTNTTTYNILPVPVLTHSIPVLLLTVVIPQVVSCQEYHTSGNGVCYIIYTCLVDQGGGQCFVPNHSYYDTTE